MKKLFRITVILAFILTGCAGREAQKIEVVKDSDYGKSCEQLELEVRSHDSQIKGLLIEHSKKMAGNTAAAVGGLLFLPVLLAMDLKGAAKAEYEALHKRNQHLASVASSKNCPPIRVKTIEEYKAEIAQEKKANRTTSTTKTSATR